MALFNEFEVGIKTLLITHTKGNDNEPKYTPFNMVGKWKYSGKKGEKDTLFHVFIMSRILVSLLGDLRDILTFQNYHTIDNFYSQYILQ